MCGNICQISDVQVPLMCLGTNLKSIQQPFCPGLTETSPHSILTRSTDGAICQILLCLTLLSALHGFAVKSF